MTCGFSVLRSTTELFESLLWNYLGIYTAFFEYTESCTQNQRLKRPLLYYWAIYPLYLNSLIIDISYLCIHVQNKNMLYTWIIQTAAIPNFSSFTLCLYLVGLIGVIYNQKNFLITMLNIELVYLAVITSFLFISLYVCYMVQIYSLMLLVIAASESVIGLGILVLLFRFNRSINFTKYQELRG